MAEQKQVALNLAGMVVNETGKFMNAVEEFQNIYEWANSAGIVFTGYEDDIAASEPLQHAIGQNYNQVAGFILPGLVAWLKTQTISGGDLAGKTYWEAMQMLRRA